MTVTAESNDQAWPAGTTQAIRHQLTKHHPDERQTLELDEYDKEPQLLDIIFKIISSITQIWASLSEDQKDSICKTFTDLMEDLFRAFYKANSGGEQ